MNNKHNLENSEAFSPTNSPAIPLNADLAVQREAPGGLAEADKIVELPDFYGWDGHSLEQKQSRINEFCKSLQETISNLGLFE